MRSEEILKIHEFVLILLFSVLTTEVFIIYIYIYIYIYEKISFFIKVAY